MLKFLSFFLLAEFGPKIWTFLMFVSSKWSPFNFYGKFGLKILLKLFQKIATLFACQTYRRNRAEVFCKKGVLRNLQENSQENTCARVSFLAQVFSYELGEISKNTFFYRTPLVAASKRSSYNVRKNVFFPTKKSERMQCKYNRKLNAKTHGNFKERKDRTPVLQRMDIWWKDLVSKFNKQ